MCACSFLAGYGLCETIRLVREIHAYRRAKALLG
jgi:hypothetical protein